MKQRWYKVVFETIERKPIRRTVTVCSTRTVFMRLLWYISSSVERKSR